MDRRELVAAFQDTMSIAKGPKLAKATEAAAASTRLYPEGFRTQNRRPPGKAGRITVEEDTTFAAASRYRPFGRTAVLNFANPVTPGGGVYSGAMAQEECLCRSSNLYACLTASPHPDYYGFHAVLDDRFSSDRLLYTQGVTVFKNDEALPRLLPKKQWFQVDVITCAAPYLTGEGYINKTALKAIFKRRIRNILEAALDNGAAVLILGAFGCGAFKNPPDTVAAAFRETIEENGYDKQFDRIVFAIKKSADRKNYRAFIDAFFPLTVNCPIYELEKLPLPSGRTLLGMAVCFLHTPPHMTPDLIEEWLAEGQGEPVQEIYLNREDSSQREAYIRWKVKNPYYKKQFSVLGDSVSTLSGYNPEGYNLFFTGSACRKAGVWKMEDTWWGKVISYFGGELLVNNAWSGSRVTRLPGRTELFPSGCSDERTSGLHISEVMPDVILIYLGANDWGYGVKPEEADGRAAEDDTVFAEAYGDMLAKLRRRYPAAEIFCCTLSETAFSSDPSFRFPPSYGGEHIERYNQVIRSAAAAAGCRLIDLYRYHVPYDTIDGTHPNAQGMNTLATLMLREMCGPEGAAFLDCDGGHDFMTSASPAGGLLQVCRSCGMVRRDLALIPPEETQSALPEEET